MSWNPQINLKLRDDEVTFGSLIFDKGSAELLCKAIIAIKNGQQVGNDVIKDIIKNGCYTNDELEGLRKDFDEVKNDISYFKGLYHGNFVSGLGNWAKRVDANVGYITGSNTWIEKYKELKMCACEMYETLLGKGYEFTAQEKATFDKRYGDILKSTTSKERLDGVLRKQYYEDLAAGVPNAADIYIQAQVDNGIISEQQAEGRRRLLGAASKSSDVSSKSETNIPVTDDVGVHVEDTKKSDEGLTLTDKMVIDKLAEINALTSSDVRDLAIISLYKCIRGALSEVSMDLTKADSIVEQWEHSMPTGVYLGKEASTYLVDLMKQAGSPTLRVLFNSIAYIIKKEAWDAIIRVN